MKQHIQSTENIHCTVKHYFYIWLIHVWAGEGRLRVSDCSLANSTIRRIDLQGGANGGRVEGMTAGDTAAGNHL